MAAAAPPSGSALARGRAACQAGAWDEGYGALVAADEAGGLGPEDLERLATAAYLSGRRDEFFETSARAHRAWLHSGDRARAARVAFWIGMHLLLAGQTGTATGWVARARRLLEQAGTDLVEQGYLLLPAAEQQLHGGDYAAAASTASAVAAVAERFGDPELVAIARHVLGRALIGQGRVEPGLALLDETMVAVMAERLSPIVTGLLYCSVIGACQEVYAVERASEWTKAMARWCEKQPQMVAFTGTCLVHRSEILQLEGAWPDALTEAERACQRYAQGLDPRPPAAAFYQQAELHRLRGEFEAAEAAYRRASHWGCDPQPGLALLRLAEGQHQAAAAGIRRAIGQAANPFERARLLPGAIEVLLATGDLDAAQAACGELEVIVRTLDTAVLKAAAAHARGAALLAGRDPQAALEPLRFAWRAWLQLEAPYQTARTRELLGLACRAVGDEDGARLDLDAARDELVRLGADPDARRVTALASEGERAPRNARVPVRPHGLTLRELEVLRLVAAGKTNKAIARDLILSEKTIDRHVSNIFAKLDVPSRAAATAFAYEHDLVRPRAPGPTRTG